MILDKIENIGTYYGVSKRLNQAFDYLRTSDFSTLENGIHKIEGKRLFVIINEYKTKPNELKILEAHKKYIDLQFIQKGEEIIDYEPLMEQKIHKEYDKENDYVLYSTTQSTRLRLAEGMFAVFFPDDLHLPGIIDCNITDVRKIVIKILID